MNYAFKSVSRMEREKLPVQFLDESVRSESKFLHDIMR